MVLSMACLGSSRQRQGNSKNSRSISMVRKSEGSKKKMKIRIPELRRKRRRSQLNLKNAINVTNSESSHRFLLNLTDHQPALGQDIEF